MSFACHPTHQFSHHSHDRPLRILMLAPEPFFEPRGTPFSEYHRIKALTELGHHVDLVTYPFGSDVPLPNLRIIRAARPPFAERVRIGPSFTKLVLDALPGGHRVAAGASRALRSRSIRTRRQVCFGVWLARRLGIPHLYDMHSSLPQQLTNFRFASSRLLRRAFEVMEDRTVFGSDVVVTICQDLQDHVTAMGAGERAVLIENVMGGDVEDAPQSSAALIRRTMGDCRRCAVGPLHGYLRGLPGTRSAPRRRDDRGALTPGYASAGCRRPTRAGRAGAREGWSVRDLYRVSTGARDPGICRGC